MKIPHDLAAVAMTPAKDLIFTSREVEEGKLIPLPNNLGLVCTPETFEQIKGSIKEGRSNGTSSITGEG